MTFYCMYVFDNSMQSRLKNECYGTHPDVNVPDIPGYFINLSHIVVLSLPSIAINLFQRSFSN